MLALSPEPPHAFLAKMELKDDLSTEDRVAVADGWWDVAKREKVGKRTIRARAAHWYKQALPSLRGIAMDRVLKRLAEIEGSTDTVEAVDLLKVLSEVKINREWQLQSGVLRSPNAVSQITIPYVPPKEYHLRVVLERKSGKDLFSVVVP